MMIWPIIATAVTLGILGTLAYFAFRKEVEVSDRFFRGDDDLPDGWA